MKGRKDIPDVTEVSTAPEPGTNENPFPFLPQNYIPSNKEEEKFTLF